MKKILIYVAVGIVLAGLTGYAWLNTCGGYELRLNNIMVIFGEPDESDLDLDGPYLFHQKDSLIEFKVTNGTIERKSLSNGDSSLVFTCFAEEINAKFSFQLFDFSADTGSVYKDANPIFVVSDIEGNFKDFRQILQSSGVIDDNYKWIFGKGHLVLLGDYFDRGWDVMPCLWLCYELQRQAKLAGGKVHFILGNHEFMNLTGDNRYVDIKYRAFANEIGLNYKDLFSQKSELGEWLRTKNAVVKIGDYVFTHGGISPQVISQRLSIPHLNRIVRESMDHPSTDSSSTPYLLTEHEDSPLWYRAYVRGDTLSQEAVNAITAALDCSVIFVGHTSVKKIERKYSGKIIPVDVDHRKLRGSGKSRAVLISNGKMWGVNERGLKLEL